MTTRKLTWLPVLGVAALLGACAEPPSRPPLAEPVYSAPYVQHGTVRSIRMVRVDDPTTGGGALLGGAVGAVAGNQIGHGGGRAAATMLGAIGGAIIGNQVERNRNYAYDAVRVTVRFDSGDIRSFDFESVGDLRVGERVRSDGYQLFRG